MKKLIFSCLLALGAIALLQGCSSKVGQLSLRVQLVKLERKADGSLLASLLFSNPSVYPLNLKESTHQLSLNGIPVGDLVVVEPIGVPSMQTTTATVALTHRVGNAANVSGSVSYLLTSKLTLKIYDENDEKYKTSSSGTV